MCGIWSTRVCWMPPRLPLRFRRCKKNFVATSKRFVPFLMASIAEVFRLAPNSIAVQGHVASVPVVSRENPVWSLSSDRADAVRHLLVNASLDEERMQRVTGYADRQPVSGNPLSVRNNRIEIILLRSRL